MAIAMVRTQDVDGVWVDDEATFALGVQVRKARVQQGCCESVSQVATPSTGMAREPRLHSVRDVVKCVNEYASSGEVSVRATASKSGGPTGGGMSGTGGRGGRGGGGGQDNLSVEATHCPLLDTSQRLNPIASARLTDPHQSGGVCSRRLALPESRTSQNGGGAGDGGGGFGTSEGAAVAAASSENVGPRTCSLRMTGRLSLTTGGDGGGLAWSASTRATCAIGSVFHHGGEGGAAATSSMRTTSSGGLMTSLSSSIRTARTNPRPTNSTPSSNERRRKRSLPAAY
eukprot:4121516-Prymnesium_polylepis.2